MQIQGEARIMLYRQMDFESTDIYKCHQLLAEAAIITGVHFCQLRRATVK